MKLKELVLRAKPSLEDTEWKFTIPPQYMSAQHRRERMLKITFSDAGMVLDSDKISSNRILHADDPTKFVLLGVRRTFRFPDHPPRVVADYLVKMFQTGVFLNGVQYRFYHHSNSQLRDRSCFLREANNDQELDDRIYQMGDYGRIMNVSKRAKRIGLLFSSAEVDFQLDPKYVADIPDIEIGDEVFSDGCGLMSKALAILVAKKKKITFRGTRYTPTVVQIRYLGYKGVLMLHPLMDSWNANRDRDTENKRLAEFRKSMKKFTATGDTSFSVVGYSKPYSFGRLNNDIIVLVSSLGVSNDAFRAKQQAYFKWIQDAAVDLTAAVDFLSSTDKYALAEKVMLDGLTEEHVKAIRKLQVEELGRHHDTETKKFKTRMLIHKSRRLYGVCDPLGVLKEGQVHIRVTTGRKGPSTPIHGDVLVVRNPCLHPGDCLKLRAVSRDELAHLVDCIVFATVAKPGHKPAPSMSSGGDLDGDEFFVCWDPDIVPEKELEAYDYPPNRERKSKNVTRMDLATYFASYSTSGVARVSALHNKWATASPLGALCAECQELNALHSQAVDGGHINIPDRLTHPPEPGENYIIDLLRKDEEAFEAKFLEDRSNIVAALQDAEVEEPKVILERFLKTKSSTNALSEYEIFDLALRFSRKHGFDLVPFLPLLDVSALSATEKHIVSAALGLSRIDFPFIWNSLFQSDILSSTDLNCKGLDTSGSLQRLYSSNVQSQATFFEYLRRATESYKRKLLLIRTDNRFAVGIFMRGDVPWDDDQDVEEVSVVTFLSESAALIPEKMTCPKGYKLHCSYTKMELYNRHRGDTFIFIHRSPSGFQSEVVTSIAPGKISGTVQRNIGRINKTAIQNIELHVVSNQDRVAHQLFDMWYDHVPTEEYLPRFPRRVAPYRQHDLRDVDWDPPFVPPDNEEELSELQLEDLRQEWRTKVRQLAIIRDVVYPFREDERMPRGKTRRQHDDRSIERPLCNATIEDIDAVLEFTVAYHMEDELFLVFHHALVRGMPEAFFICKWIERVPGLVFVLLRVLPPTDDTLLHDEIMNLDWDVTLNIVKAIVRSANETRIAALVALEKIAASIASIRISDYMDLLMSVPLSVRAKDLVQEVLLVLHESRLNHLPQPLSSKDHYAHKHALNIVFDRAEEAADECPCNDDGRPRAKQSVPPTQISLAFQSDSSSPFSVKGDIRVDAKHAIRLHSHVRFKATSKPDNAFIPTPVLDGVVTVAFKGEYRFKLMQPAPPELGKIEGWLVHNAGSIATSQAMLDALKTLMQEKSGCCRFYDIITGDVPHPTLPSLHDEDDEEDHNRRSKGKERENRIEEGDQTDADDDNSDDGGYDGPDLEGEIDIVVPPDVSLNESQLLAVRSWDARLSLIWGPPGTGKTTVVVQILRSILLTYAEGRRPRILMTASTHNAVDNVLERFVRMNAQEKLLSDDQILRVATDQLKVNEDLHQVKKAVLVFSTCAGAGLGILRKFNFDIAIIDEASQITEPCALIPFVKGIKKGIMVGDHVQLRPLVRKVGTVLEGDVSLLERLYTQGDVLGLKKTMLDVQYRSPEQLNAFPSTEFYQGRLKTADTNEAKLEVLRALPFPWPIQNGAIVPTVFIHCAAEEDFGGRSKSNEGQIYVISKVIELLKASHTGSSSSTSSSVPSITILSPYRGQIMKIKNRIPSVPVATVDSFQGRESDIIIFSTVRSNADNEIGFLEDHRRLNVMWTRARIALIIVGNEVTLCQGSELWKRALQACQKTSNPSLFDPPPPEETEEGA